MYDIRKIQEQVIYEAVKNSSCDEVAGEIVYGKNDVAKAEDNPTWVMSTMRRLEDQFDRPEISRIRWNCQCGYGMEEKVVFLNELMELTTNMEEFGSMEKAKAAGLFYDNGELYLQFFLCPCPMLRDVVQLETDTWCLCTTGYSKVLFEKAFECKVDVELLKSIKMGDEICLMKIIPKGTIVKWDK